MSEMESYFYCFHPTGVEPIDRILSAVASAGKRFHNTSDWTDDDFPGSEGKSVADRIQDTAEEAAALVGRMREALEGVMTGGNHLVQIIGPGEPPLPQTTSFYDALQHYGAGDKYDAWCCWKNIMDARDVLESTKNAEPE